MKHFSHEYLQVFFRRARCPNIARLHEFRDYHIVMFLIIIDFLWNSERPRMRLVLHTPVADRPFSLDPLFKVLLLILQLFPDNVLLLLPALFTVLKQLLSHDLGLGLHLLQFLLIFLFLDQHCSGFSVHYFGDSWL